MITQKKNYFSLFFWIVALQLIAISIGFFNKTEMSNWYIFLNRSTLTPPSYIFPIAWTFLYTLISICGWIIWQVYSSVQLKFLKYLYVVQLLLNWIWTPLFFYYHFISLSFFVLILMNILIGTIIYFAYKPVKIVSILMIPYLLWLMFAGYLNGYIWYYN